MAIDSLLRKAEHLALEGISLTGRVLDLGGDRRSTYRSFFTGDAEYTILNLSPESQPDIVHDLEQPLPNADGTYDGVLLINVLEHIYACQQLMHESVRVLKPGGKLVIVVPFLFPIHPSPNDYWRFSKDTLERMLADAGCTDIDVLPLGSGVCAARYVMLDRLLPYPLRFVGQLIIQPLVAWGDRALHALARMLGKSYDPAHYALGYRVIATRDNTHAM